MATETEWMRLTAEELRARAAEDALVIIPVASLEQHGPHLATGVDIILATGVAARTAARHRRRRRAGGGDALRLDRPGRAPHGIRRHGDAGLRKLRRVSCAAW